MIHVTAAAITVNCAISPVLASYTELANFHLEVVESKTGIKRVYQAFSVTPAVAGTQQSPSGTPGVVVFQNVDTPEDESMYLCSVYYASGADLDSSGVTINRIASGTVQKVNPVATVGI